APDNISSEQNFAGRGGGKTALEKLVKRLGLGLIGLVFFWALDRISANELAKSSVLLATALPGIAGVFLVLPWMRERPHWFSRAALVIIG
ncbi:hypothetical protein ABTH15_19520, partial [Acinetobacter baumannii]